MRCGRFRAWLNEITIYPTPSKIAAHLEAELRAAEAPIPADGSGSDSPRQRHLRRCQRCRDRVSEALRYWSLLAGYTEKVQPSPDLELRVLQRIREDAAAGLGPSPEPEPVSRPRLFVREPEPACLEEQQLYGDAAGYDPVVVGWLVALSGDFMGADASLAPGENLIGSAENTCVRVGHESVADYHATIVCAVTPHRTAAYVLAHAGAEVFVNGSEHPVPWHRLEDNDVLRLGEIVFKFKTLVGTPA